MKRSRLCAPVLVLLVALAILATAPCFALQKTVVLQPGPGLNDGSDDGSATKGKDTFAAGYDTGTNWGSNSSALVESATCNENSAIGYLRFSLAGLPTTNIVKAEVKLLAWSWQISGAVEVDPVWSVHDIASDWDEMALTWNNQPSVQGESYATATLAGVASQTSEWLYQWVTFDITDLYRNWADGSGVNLGMKLAMDNTICPNGSGVGFFTSDIGKELYRGDFNAATVGQIDPDWERIVGIWKVATLAGYGGGKFMSSAKASPAAVALLDSDAITDGPFRTGIISALFKVGAATTRPYVLFFFDSPGPAKYRAVEIRKKLTGWYLALKQVGAYDGDTARVLGSKKLVGFNPRHWQRLEVVAAEAGGVNVKITDDAAPSKSWALTGKAFKANSGGPVGLMSRGTVFMVDNYRLSHDEEFRPKLVVTYTVTE